MNRNTLPEMLLKIIDDASKTIDGIYDENQRPELWTANVLLYISMETKKEADKMFDKHHNKDKIN
jgi:hypothetical protein